MQEIKKSEKNDRRSFLKSGVMIGAGALLAPSLSFGKAARDSSPSNDIWNVIDNRRSVRSFKSTPIPDEHLKKIINAARMSPTSGNQQPWKFLVIKDRAKIDELKDFSVKFRVNQLIEKGNASEDDIKDRRERFTKYFTQFLSAPVYVVILTNNNSTYPSYNHWDGPLAAGYLMLAARSLGYGTVFATDSIPVEATKEVFNIPDKYTRVCVTPIGVPVEWPKTPPKMDLDSFIVENSF